MAARDFSRSRDSHGSSEMIIGKPTYAIKAKPPVKLSSKPPIKLKKGSGRARRSQRMRRSRSMSR